MNAVRKALGPQGVPVEPDSRPAVIVVAGSLAANIESTQQALVERGDIFQQGARLVRVVRENTPKGRKGIRRHAGELRTLAVTADWLQAYATQHVAFLGRKAGRPTGADGTPELKPIDCPRRVAAGIIANAGAWPFPYLRGISTAPTLRNDGSILEAEGYDQETSLYLDFGGEVFPPVPTQPTLEDAKAALARVYTGVYAQFPFVKREHRAVALALPLTAAIRHALRTAPAFAVSATTMGTGKSLLVDASCMISTGVPALSVAYTPDEAEMQKRLVAVLIESAPYLSIDNIDLPVESSILCSALTQPTIKGRILGETATVTASTATTVTLTGNNLQVSGDMSTRVVQVELDAGVERPEDREFAKNLYEWVPANRASLVVDLLTVLRAFVVAGRPPQAFTRWGRFEEWSDVVRSALVWTGEADPVMTRDEVQAGDPVKAALGAVLAAWDAALGKGFVTAGRIVECALQTSSLAPYDPLHPQLREALAEIAGDVRGGLSARRLGKWLAKYDGRIQDGRRIERGEDRQGIATWRVGSVGSVGLCLSMGKNYLEERKEFL